VSVKLKSRLSKIRLKLIEEGLLCYGVLFHLLSKLETAFTIACNLTKSLRPFTRSKISRGILSPVAE